MATKKKRGKVQPPSPAPERNHGMEWFAGYLDILGTKDMVSRGDFSDFHALDFSGAAAVAAWQFRSSRFAAFSDCVIFSCPADKPDELIDVLCHLFQNWLSDGILARGGIAIGEVRWVDHEMDHQFGKFGNFTAARVYGKAISEAVEIERSSGPGIVPFASDAVADRIFEQMDDAVLRLSSNILRAFEWHKLGPWIGMLDGFLEHQKSQHAQRHLLATRRIFELFNSTFGSNQGQV